MCWLVTNKIKVYVIRQLQWPQEINADLRSNFVTELWVWAKNKNATDRMVKTKLVQVFVQA